MFYARIRFSGVSASIWEEAIGLGSKWYCDNLKYLYQDMHHLARIARRHVQGTPHEKLRITFRLYNEYGVTIGDRFYYGNHI